MLLILIFVLLPAFTKEQSVSLPYIYNKYIYIKSLVEGQILIVYLLTELDLLVLAVALQEIIKFE